LSSSELKKSHESLLNELIQTKNEINLQLEQHQNNLLTENDSVKSLSSLASKTLNNIEKITKLSEQRNGQIHHTCKNKYIHYEKRF
jgi:hypothetical protein